MEYRQRRNIVWWITVSFIGIGLYLASHLIPYYVAGIFVLQVQALLGLRMVLLRQEKGGRRANRIVFALAGGAAVATLLIASGMFGVHLGAG